MDIFIGKHNSKISTKVTTKVKDLILKICEVKEISESQFLRIAIQNQIKADQSGQSVTPKTFES